MATLGYARTSTRDQETGLQAQIRDLIAAGCAERDIYTEQASSVRERPELDLLRRRILRPGDELVVTRLDRLARSARDTLALAEELGQRGVTLKILDPAMTIEPPGRANGSMAGAMSRMILTVMAAMAQLEREIMLERQREGIAREGRGQVQGTAAARSRQGAPGHRAGRRRLHPGRDRRRPRNQRALGLPHPRREPLQHQLNVAQRQAGPGRLIHAVDRQKLRRQIGLYDGAGLPRLRARSHCSSFLLSARADRLFCICQY